MAEKRSTVELVFQGIDRTSEATKAALGNAEKFSKSLGNATAPVADFTKSAAKVEGALLAAGAAITAFSIKAAGDFDSAFREISTLIDQPLEDLDDFRQGILDYATTSTKGLDEITGAVYSAISAGVEYTDSLEAVRVAEELAVAGKADLQSTLKVLVSSLNSYGLEMDDAARFADALFTTVKEGQTTLPELANSLSRVTGTAANTGIEFEELLASIAAITAGGAPTSQAISGVKAALDNIIKPTQKAKDLASDLSIEFNAEALEAKGLSGVLDDVMEATGGNVTQMGKLFSSSEGLNAMLQLTGVSAEAFSGTLESMETNSGAVSTAFDKMADSFDNSNQKIKNAIQGALISIGGPLLDEYGGIAEGIAAIFNAIGQDVQSGQLGGLVEYIESVMGDAVTALAEIAQALPEAFEEADLSGFERGLESIVTAVTGLFEGFDLTTARGLASAIEGVGQAFFILSDFTAGAIESLQLIFDMIANSDGNIADFAEDWANTAGQIAGFTTQLNALMPAIDTLITAITGLVGILAVKQTGSLVSSARGAKLGLKGLAVSMGPGGAVAIAAIYLGTQLYKIVEGLGEIKDANERAEKAQNDYAVSAAEVEGRLSGISKRLGITIDGMDHFRQLVDEGSIAFDEATGRWVAGGDALEDTGDKAGQAGQKIKDSTFSAQEGADALSKALEEGGDNFGALALSVKDGETDIERFGQASSDAFGDAASAAEQATQASESYRLKLASIASEERVAVIEAQLDFDAAQLENETKRIEAAFESVNETIGSTGDLLGGLAKSLTESENWADWRRINELIEAEERRRDTALDKQNELIDAQISLTKQRTEALQSGDALINIDGAGLQPHLEAVMWEMLRAIQVRVNEDGLEMLLGSQ